MEQVKVLYVEDEPFLGKIVKESLESRNFLVQMEENGGTAFSAFQQFQPDICVLDVMLPGKDGFAIGQEIRSIDATTPIIFLTARNQTEDVLKGFKIGGNDYLKKPFSMEELIVRIHNLLRLAQGRMPHTSTEEGISLGEYTFFPNKYELRQQNQIRQLSHRETELLKIFCRHQNIPVQRKDILNQVWGDDSFFNSRNLDVYIKKLRDYLSADNSVRIVTLKGVGYHFIVE